MDGGQIQVNACLETLNSLNINIPVAGIQKDDNHKAKLLYYEGKENIHFILNKRNGGYSFGNNVGIKYAINAFHSKYPIPAQNVSQEGKKSPARCSAPGWGSFLGEGMDLHPATVVACLIFWTLVWGVPGAFLSVPITASIKIVLSKIKHTRPVAEFLAGRLPH